MTQSNTAPLPPLRWRNVLVMLILPVALSITTAGLLVYYWENITPTDVLTTGAWLSFWLFFCVVSVCIKHRLYSHKNGGFIKGWAEVFYALTSVIDVQGSILRWSTDHRHHHHGQDPHDIKRGWWWACYGWMLRHYPEMEGMNGDLLRKKILVWQDKHYGALLLFVCYVPLIILSMLVAVYTPISFWQVLLPVVWAQVLTQQNTIFFVNVLSHFPKLGISYDNSQATDLRGLAGLWGGFFTGGEGRRHGRHHIMPHQPFLGYWDWNGWVLRAMARLKLIQINAPLKLRDVPAAVARRLDTAHNALKPRVSSPNRQPPSTV